MNDVKKDAASSLAEELGCSHAQTLAQVTALSDIILTVVTNDAAMESIFFGADDNLFQDSADTFSSTQTTLSPAMHVSLERVEPGKRITTSRVVWLPVSLKPGKEHCI